MSAAVSELLDYAKASPGSFTWEHLNILHGWSYAKFMRTVHDLRLTLGEDDTMNLVCEPNGIGPWEYRLVGSLADQAWWQANRQGDTITRINTELAVNRSIVRGTSGRTIEGRRARVISKALSRLIEDLEDLDVT